jgi:hypothetical protein
MALTDRIKQLVTGKNELERKQEAYANAEIRKKVLATELREREKANIMLAEERIRQKAKEKLNKIRRPVGMFGSVPGGAYGNPFGQPRNLIRGQVQPRAIRIKSKKSRRRRIHSGNPSKEIQSSQRRYDPIFGLYR